MNLNNPALRTDTPWAFIVSLLVKVLNQTRLKANWVKQKWKARREDSRDEGDDWGGWERSRRENLLPSCYPKALTLVLFLTVRGFTNLMRTANNLLKTSVKSSVFTFKDWCPGEGTLSFCLLPSPSPSLLLRWIFVLSILWPVSYYKSEGWAYCFDCLCSSSLWI